MGSYPDSRLSQSRSSRPTAWHCTVIWIWSSSGKPTTLLREVASISRRDVAERRAQPGGCHCRYGHGSEHLWRAVAGLEAKAEGRGSSGRYRSWSSASRWMLAIRSSVSYMLRRLPSGALGMENSGWSSEFELHVEDHTPNLPKHTLTYDEDTGRWPLETDRSTRSWRP